MHKYYRFIILFCLFGISLILISYYFYTMPVPEKKIKNKTLVYKEQLVNGPIQPLPKIIRINQQWVSLGKALFNSPLLSKNNTVSCASCHNVDAGGDDGFPVSIGINNQLGTRNSPTVLNAVLNFRQFWDGREHTIKEQASGPIHNPIEMNSNFDEIIPKLNADTFFSKAFLALDNQGITEQNIINAIVMYESSLITPNSPIDNYLLGDENALSEQQKNGLEKFTNFGCITCHQGRNIGGNIYQKLGKISLAPPNLLLDKGRFNITKNQSDLHVFKVPSLRNIALTAPYFHDGSISTLPEAVKLMGKLQLGMDIPDNDVDDIVSLLQAFTGEVPSNIKG